MNSHYCYACGKNFEPIVQTDGIKRCAYCYTIIKETKSPSSK